MSNIWKTTFLSSRRGIISAGISAVDIALWDLEGKALKMPVYQLLGAYADEVKCYASAGLYGKNKGVSELSTEIRNYKKQGFKDVKIKVGGLPLNEDEERVKATREIIGSNSRLMIDANYNLNVTESIKMATTLDKYNIYWFEAPSSPYDITGQAFVNNKSPIASMNIPKTT